MLEYVIINLFNPLIFTYRVYRSYAEYSHKIIIDGCIIDWFVNKDSEGSFSYPNISRLSQHTMGLCYLNKSSDILHEHPIFATDIDDLLDKIHLNNLFNNCIIEEF